MCAFWERRVHREEMDNIIRTGEIKTAGNLTWRKTKLKIQNCTMMAFLMTGFRDDNLKSTNSKLSFIGHLNILHLKKF